MMVKVWIDAARPKTLGASLAPILIGAALSAKLNSFSLTFTLIALASALCIQIATNFCNDYCDFKKGADKNRIGPIRATQSGLIAPEMMRRATILTFALAVAFGALLVARGGWPIVLIGVLSVTFGALYTAGSYPLAYLGLGDLFVLIFFGPVAVVGTYYVNSLEWSRHAALLGFLPGLLSVAILVVNNLRDAESDRASNKRTLVVLLGERFGRFEYAACVLAPAIIVAFQGALLGKLGASCASSFLILGGGVLTMKLTRQRGAALNPFLPATNLFLIATSGIVSFLLLHPL
jgi:1,4-dihydroxy-2-naphthoate octaprenyltransferase